VINWLLNLIPQEWKISVAIKKASYTIGKLAVAGLMYGKAKTLVGSHLTPDQMNQVQMAIAAISAGALEGIHDWARLKWPGLTWL
jgi:hypothetical protein